MGGRLEGLYHSRKARPKRMKKYEDVRVSFAYPDEFKLKRAKQAWGQYDLKRTLAERKYLWIFIQIVPDAEVFDACKRVIRDCPFDEFAVGEYYESVVIGGKKGIGHVVTLYDPYHRFIETVYRYLLPPATGGLYIEVAGDAEFASDTFQIVLESITVKGPSCTQNRR